jgi:hypothetical protein
MNVYTPKTNPLTNKVDTAETVIDGFLIGIPFVAANKDYQKMLDSVIEYGAACFNGAIPAQVQTDADAKLFNEQLVAYRKAVARLEQYIVADGQPEIVTELPDPTGATQVNEETGYVEPVMVVVVVQKYIPPAPTPVEVREWDEATQSFVTREIENPLITEDNAERAAAQEVVDNTPQDVKDAA